MSGRSKRQAKMPEENYWDCSVCTYQNTAEAYKCLICDVRKGTSTRKPRINQQIAAQQYTPAPTAATVPGPPTLKAPQSPDDETTKEQSNRKRSHKTGKRTWPPPKFKYVDRSSAQTREVTVNNITVMITEYQPKAIYLPESEDSSSSSDSEADSHSTNSISESPSS